MVCMLEELKITAYHMCALIPVVSLRNYFWKMDGFDFLFLTATLKSLTIICPFH